MVGWVRRRHGRWSGGPGGQRLSFEVGTRRMYDIQHFTFYEIRRNFGFGCQTGSQDQLLPPSNRISKYAELSQLSAISNQNWAKVTTRGVIKFLPERPSTLALSVEKKASIYST